VLLVDGQGQPTTRMLAALLADASPAYATAPTEPDDLALLHFTSGTTGKPKAAVHVHEAVLAHHVTAGYALGLRPDDVFWCTADPGWVTGTSYGLIAPLTHGVTAVTDAGEFDARRWYRVLQDHRVTVWYTAPTALRMLMRARADLAGEFDLPDLPKVEPEQSAPADELKDPLFDLDVMDFSLPQGGAAAEPQAEAAQETEALDDPFALPELAATPAPAPAMPAFDLSDIDLDLPEPATAELPLPEVEIEMEGVGAGAGDLSPAHMEMETKLDLALAYQEIGDKEGARELLDEVIKGGNGEQVSKATAMREKLA
jgi:FimV-like protein